MHYEKRIQTCIGAALCVSLFVIKFDWPLFLTRMLISLGALFYLQSSLQNERAPDLKKLVLIRYSILIAYAAVGVGFVFTIANFIRELNALLA